jgi:hypothetical protein
MDGPFPVDSKDSSYTLKAESVQKIKFNIPDRFNELHPFRQSFTFFTPAIAYIYGRLNDAFFTDFLATYGQEVGFFHYRFNKPIFKGLEVNKEPSWNHVLWAVYNEHWEAFSDHFCSAVQLAPDVKQVVRFAEQEIDIADPLMLDRVAILPIKMPFMSIKVIALRGSHSQATLEVGTNPGLNKPKLHWWEPAEDVRLYAQQLYGELPKPLKELSDES